MMFRRALLALVLVSALPLRVAHFLLAQQSTPANTSLVQVQLITDEADQALALLQTQRAGRAISNEAWDRLFATQGYQALKRRETAMGRAFSDAEFKTFLLSDTLAARTAPLAQALERLRKLDPTAAGRRALAYLPAGTPLKAKLFLEIKPRTNSFVFDLDGTRAIFLYIDPKVSAPEVENTMAHELHHVGISAACNAPPDTTLDATVRAAREWATAFGEGLAMLAAAGGPQTNPHALSDSATRARWDHDVANFPRDFATLQEFFTDLLDGRISGDSLQTVGMSFFGIQGPWYTVGWRMATAIEQTQGRARLVSVICDPAAFFSAYNAAAEEMSRKGQPMPAWKEETIRRMKGKG